MSHLPVLQRTHFAGKVQAFESLRSGVFELAYAPPVKVPAEVDQVLRLVCGAGTWSLAHVLGGRPHLLGNGPGRLQQFGGHLVQFVLVDDFGGEYHGDGKRQRVA